MLVYYVLVVAGLRSLLSPGVYTLPMERDDGVNDAPGLPPPDLPKGSDTDKSKRILKIMETKGLDYKNAIEQETRQYLVVTVLSDEEFKRNDFTTSASVPDNRTQVLLNLNMTGLPSYYGVNKVHGEILTLYINKTIDVLLQLLVVHADSSSNLPYVFVYSYYIPCAGLVGFNYSCAEELANAGRVNRNRYSLIVGYNTSYTQTNVTLALQYLNEGGITHVINIKTGNVSRDRHNLEPKTYQENMFNCLMQHNILDFVQTDAAYIVNHVIKQCTQNSDRYGYITQFGKAQLHECVIQCTCIRLNLELIYCSVQTLGEDVRLMLGEPINMCKAEWKRTPDDFKWNRLYDMYEPTSRTHSVEHVRLRTKESNDKLSKLCNKAITKKTSRKSNLHREGLERVRKYVKSERKRPSPKSHSVCPLLSVWAET